MNNTDEFKAFKLHSDSTLKSLTKVELISYIHALYQNWQATYESYHNVIENAMKLVGKTKWIPVEERLPEEHDSIFKPFYGTDRWNNSMYQSSSDNVNVTIEFEDGSKKTETSHTNDGVWRIEKERQIFKCKVIAWQPLPEAWKGVSEDE